MAKSKHDPFVTGLIKSVDNKYASVVSDGIVGDESGTIDSGSYLLNAQLSGSIYGGFSSNKVTAIAGESGVGKTFFAIEEIISFQKKHETGISLYFESESAVTKKMMEERGIDVKRVIMLPVETVQQFRNQLMNILNNYEADSNPEKPKLLVVLDSLGNLSTTKEITDITDGKETRDMTRAQLVRGTFRALTLKMGLLNVPMCLTNHTYETMGLFAQKKMGGGGGVVYAASSIIFLSKAQDKEGTDVVGAILTSTLQKGRLTKEKTKIKIRLNFQTGLDRYYGLVEFGEKAGCWKKLATQYQMPDGTKRYEKFMYKNPEMFFTEENLKKIDEFCNGYFMYGSSVEVDDEEIEDVASA